MLAVRIVILMTFLSKKLVIRMDAEFEIVETGLSPNFQPDSISSLVGQMIPEKSYGA